MTEDRNRLISRFERQRDFAAGYSPLYSRLFGIVSEWLLDSNAEKDPIVRWLIDVSRERSSLSAALLLVAGLHRDVLAGRPDVSELAQYFPTAGGHLSPQEPALKEALRTAVLSNRESLGKSIREGRVQTNETGRGLCWVLPALLSGWPEIHVVDLGASAGLNLVANRRSFTLQDANDDQLSITIGSAQKRQFITYCSEGSEVIERLHGRNMPVILSRTGCDLAPFRLQTEEDQLLLKSFIWGDQVERMDRLCEAMEVFKDVQESPAPIHLFPCRLPDELGHFLVDRVPAGRAPVVIYNTFMTAYLPDKGASMVDLIGTWAAEQGRPVLWAQWEPARNQNAPYREEMNLWSADFWNAGEYCRYSIGWVHPHGGEAAFLEDWLPGFCL